MQLLLINSWDWGRSTQGNTCHVWREKHEAIEVRDVCVTILLLDVTLTHIGADSLTVSLDRG